MSTEPSRCAICLMEPPKDVTRPDPDSCATHLFCFECIWTWAKNSSSCPLCRQHIAALLTLDPTSSSGRVLYRVCPQVTLLFVSQHPQKEVPAVQQKASDPELDFLALLTCRV